MADRRPWLEGSWPGSRARLVPLVLLAAVLAAVAVVAYDSAGNDLRVFRTAAARFLAGEDLYPAADGFYAWRYAPGAALLFTPLVAVPHAAARAGWLAAIVVLLVAVAARLAARLPRHGWWAAPAATAALLNPIAHELQHGQANVLALALVLAAFELDERERPFLGGLVLAWPVALKVTPALLALDLLLRRRWRALGGLAAGIAAVAALPALTHGLEGAVALHLSWLGAESVSAGQVLTLYRNQSVPSLLARVGAPRLLGALAALAVVAAAATARDGARRRGLLLAAVTLASPYGWVQNHVFALPLVASLAATATRAGYVVLALAAGTTLVSYDVIGRKASGWALDHGVLALCMLAAFAVARAAPVSPAGAAPPARAGPARAPPP